MPTNKLTREMIDNAIEKLKESSGHVEQDYIVRIHPANIDMAYELGLSPFCPLNDDEVIEMFYE